MGWFGYYCKMSANQRQATLINYRNNNFLKETKNKQKIQTINHPVFVLHSFLDLSCPHKSGTT